MATRVSAKGAFCIAAHEGLVPARYIDLAGVDTWGVGHTHNAGQPDPREMPFEMPHHVHSAMEQAWTVFVIDLERYTDDVTNILGTTLTQAELDGWVMWHFNTGGIWATSAVDMWRRGDKESAARKLQEWNKATIGGVKRVVDALTDRRADEANLILFGRYPAREMPVYKTNGKGKVNWRPIEIYTFDDWQIFIKTTKAGNVNGGGGIVGALMVLGASAIGGIGYILAKLGELF